MPEIAEKAPLACVVITRNRKAKVLRCIQSLLAGTVVPMEIIVVDNGSDDDTCLAIAEIFPSVKIVALGRNALPSFAANCGMRRATAGFILVMADDNVVAEDFTKEIFEGAVRSPAGILGAKMCFLAQPSRIWTMGAHMNLFTGSCKFPGAGGMSELQPLEPHDAMIVHNALLIKRETIDAIGYLDSENFPIQNEEADYCLRARAAGIGVAVVPSAVLWHDTPLTSELGGRGSRDFAIESSMRAYYTGRSRILLVRKHGTFAERLVFFIAFLPLSVVAYLVLILLGDSDRLSRARAFLRGVRHGIGRPLELHG